MHIKTDSYMKVFSRTEPWSSLGCLRRIVRVCRVIFGIVLFCAFLMAIDLVIHSISLSDSLGQALSRIAVVPFLTFLAWCVGCMFIWRGVHQRTSESSLGRATGAAEPNSSLPVALVDLSKRYDIYCAIPTEDRLYEDVRIVAIRTFEEKKLAYGTALIGGHLEIESRKGVRMLVPHMNIYMICAHGSEPDYKVLKVRG